MGGMDEQEERSVIEDLLVGGLIDWLNPGWVYSTVAEMTSLTRFEDRWLYSIGVVTSLILDGLAVAGDLDERGEFGAWEVQGAEAVERIAREWKEDWWEKVPTPGAIAWLCTTEAGDRIGRAVLERETR